jgi:pSer/pThr/pTyr-binding forkhead associated (FHA) protein
MTKLRLTLLEKDGGQPADMPVGGSVECRLEPERRITIGRNALADVVVNAPSVGRRVVGITLLPDGVWVQDFGSGGGSSLEVNNQVTHRPCCSLPHGAILRVGQVAFRVELSTESS